VEGLPGRQRGQVDMLFGVAAAVAILCTAGRCSGETSWMNVSTCQCVSAEYAVVLHWLAMLWCCGC
jgi:hypothetical protein